METQLKNKLAVLQEDTEMKLDLAAHAYDKGFYQQCIHHSYAALMCTAKMMLWSKGIQSNDGHIISDFDNVFSINDDYCRFDSFQSLVFQFQRHSADVHSAEAYLENAVDFIQNVDLILSLIHI